MPDTFMPDGGSSASSVAIVAASIGARDPYCTPASARAFASRVPSARLRLLDDVGHFTPTEAPTEVADELNGLLQQAE